MTFIEMLQQGGYILPQYSSGQQTYSAPAAGMQTLQTMMQVDQGAQNRYLQGEQLNLSKSQNTQNIINSTIQNQLNRKTQERLQKQMDLSNQKLEFDMQKAILNDMKANREEMKTMFLDSDQARIQQALSDAGLDEAGLMKNMQMKGGMNFKNWMEEQVNHRKFINLQKNALDRKYKYDQGEKFINDAEKQLAKADVLAKAGILDDTVYSDFVNDLNQSTGKLIKYNSGEVTDLDFTDDTWSKISGFGDFIDEEQMKHNAKVEEQIKTAKMQEDLADAAYKTANAQMLTNTLDSRIKLNEAKAALDLAKANSEISDMQFEQEQRKLQDADWNIWLQENPNASATERSTARATIYNGTGTSGSKIDAISSPQELMARQMAEQGYTVEQIIDANQRFNSSTKTSDVNYKYDESGNIEAKVSKDGTTDYGGRTVDKDGITVTSITLGNDIYKTVGGSGKDKDQVTGLPLGVKAFLVEKVDPTTKKKKGYLKLTGGDTSARNWIYKKYGESFGWGTINDDLKDFPTKANAPEGTHWGDDGFLYVPQDNVKLPAAASSATGATFFTPKQGASSAGGKGLPSYAK